jgi:hypothetical protein
MRNVAVHIHLTDHALCIPFFLVTRSAMEKVVTSCAWLKINKG